MSIKAKLRTCASCEWIYTLKASSVGVYGSVVLVNCPKCKFSSYGARYVYGDKCYEYAKTQEPWLKRKVDRYTLKLQREIEASATNLPYTKYRALPTTRRRLIDRLGSKCKKEKINDHR